MTTLANCFYITTIFRSQGVAFWISKPPTLLTLEQLGLDAYRFKMFRWTASNMEWKLGRAKCRNIFENNNILYSIKHYTFYTVQYGTFRTFRHQLQLTSLPSLPYSSATIDEPSEPSVLISYNWRAFRTFRTHKLQLTNLPSLPLPSATIFCKTFHPILKKKKKKNSNMKKWATLFSNIDINRWMHCLKNRTQLQQD